MSKLKNKDKHFSGTHEGRNNMEDTLSDCVPDFFVITPPRSGSTWLSENISSHSDIFIPHMKEVKYFSNYKELCDLKWYLTCFSEGRDRIKGEVSPSYSILPDKTIQSIKKISPNLRIIFVFRDPIQRIWSHVKHQFRLRESIFTSFDQQEVFSNVPEAKIIESLTNNWTTAYSDYLSIVKRWMEVFPGENIYISFFDRIVENPKTLLEGIFKHLGVSEYVDWSLFPLHKKVNQGLKRKIPIKIKKFLLAFYSSKILDFANFLAANFSLTVPEDWEYIKEASLSKRAFEPYVSYFSTDKRQIGLEDILRRETLMSTHVQVLKQSYKGFRIIAIKGECVAISEVIDGIDLVSTEKSKFEELKRESKILCCSSLEEMLSVIDTFTSDKRFKVLQDTIDLQQRDLKAKEARILELQDNILERDIKAIALHSDLSARDDALKAKEQDLQVKDQRLAKMQGNIAEKDITISAIGDEIAARESVLKAREQDLKTKDQSLAEMQGSIAEKDITISAMGDEIAARDAELKAKEQDLQAKDQSLAELQGNLAEKDSTISAMGNEIADRDAALKAKEQDLQAKDQSLAELQENIADGISKMETLRAELTTIKASKWFRIHKFVFRRT